MKNAALHDQHRSLGITLQFVGRFARGGVAGLGPATVIAAQTDYRHTDTLRRLYAEDADWNSIVEDLSRAAVDEQVELDEFVKGFNHSPDGVSIHSITPAMSTVVYRTPALTWSPESLSDLYDEDDLLTFPIPVSQRDHVAWFVTRRNARVRWGTIEGIETVEHHLFVVYWDAERGLLYINSSDNDSVHEDIAATLVGSDSELLRGASIYRVFHRVERLTPTNVGLLDTRSRARRYTSYTGSDVTDAFPTVEKQTKSQTHIAGTGYLGGVPYSIAGSRKGRVWSHRTAPGIKEWTTWCDTIGAKLLDEAISVDSLIAGFIKPESIDRWPDLTALALEATPALYDALATATLSYRDRDVPWASVELRLVPHRARGTLDFTLKSDEWEVGYELALHPSGLSCRPKHEDEDVAVKRERSTTSFSDLATKRGLLVCLEQDAIVEPPGVLLKPDRELQPYLIPDDAQIDWGNVNIRKESWGTNRDVATVQGHIVELTRRGTWDVVIDDDGPGEIADVVAVREIDGALVVRLVHCKYSSADAAGGRIDDLYEVCGQAMKSARWRRDPEEMLRQLMRRERDRLRRNRQSGFIEGDAAALHRLIQRAHQLHPKYTIAIAQPGLSASRASRAQLELLASVDVYVVETSAASFAVYCSS